MQDDVTWPLDPAVTFLNHGSFGSSPRAVLAAQSAWRERLERQPIRFMDRELEGLLDTARDAVGRFLGADPSGIAFVPNATTGVNTVLRSLAFERDDELLTTDHEYNATLNALHEAARRDGARVVIARIPFPIGDPGEAVEAVLRAATPRTRLALVSHVTSPTAIVLPVEQLVRALAERGIDTLVDGAHAPGMLPLDVDALGAAYWTANGHKWLCAPKGCAVLWARADRRSHVRPLVISHGANELRTDRPRFKLEFDWPGTVDPTPYLTLPDAIRIVGELEPGGWPALMAANHALALAARDRLVRALGIDPPAPDSMLGAMAAVPLPIADASPTELDARARALHDALIDEDGIEVPVWAWPVRAAREGGPARRIVLRVSAQRYNTLDDYDRLADALRRRLGSSSATVLAAE